MSKDIYLKCEYYADLFYKCSTYDTSCNQLSLHFLTQYSCHKYGFRY